MEKFHLVRRTRVCLLEKWKRDEEKEEGEEEDEEKEEEEGTTGRVTRNRDTQYTAS